MTHLSPLKLLGMLVAIVATGFSSPAQTLETIDMSTITTGYNTYVTGLNNRGYITGYSNQGGNVGFIITPEGTKLLVDPVALGVTETKVESINDNESPVAIVTTNTGGTIGIYRCYIDEANDTISHFVQVTGLTQPSSVAFDINNNNDISGWFQSSTRFLFVKHDSIVPTGNSAYEAARYSTNPGPVYYNTWAGGINDANKVAGYYLDGTIEEPYVYDNIAGTFTPLAIAQKTKIWDINNNDWVAGEYQVGGVWTGFYANVSTGNFTQITSLASIFETNTPAIVSVANAINDNGEVAGSFLHPTLNRWVGFLYRPNAGEYRLPGFSYAQNTWAMKNTATGNNNVFPSTYWQGFNYFTVDPYTYNGVALVDLTISQQFVVNSLAANTYPTWKALAHEVDGAQWGMGTSPFQQNYYKLIAKPILFGKYGAVAETAFKGFCYGFSYTTLLRLYDDPSFSSWFAMPANSNISQINNTDTIAIKAIERTQFKQLDQPNLLKYSVLYYSNISPWAGLYRLKNTYRLPVNQTNPRAVYFKQSTSGNHGYHSILPYKIRTPQKLPFDFPLMKYDTMFIYDSNFPGDSSKYMTVRSIEYSAPPDSAKCTSYPNMVYLSFNDASLQDIQQVQNTVYKSTSSNDVLKHLDFSLMRNLYYQVNGSGLSQASLNNSGFTNEATDFIPVEVKSTESILPYSFKLDTMNTVTFTTYNYADDAMVWLQSNKSKSMGISREAVLNETDHGTLKNRYISYGNPDNTTKYLNCYLNEFTSDQQQGVMIMAAGVCADQGDSIVTENPSPYVYKITKVTGTTNCTYDLTVYAAYDGTTVHEFSSPVELSGTTTHTIDPYFVGLNGVQIAVIVDNGNDGIADDTLFIAGFPVDMKNTISKGGIKIYPNPVQGELTIEFAAAGNYNIIISDVVGKTLYQNTIAASAGKTTLPMGQYPTGMYLIQIADQKGNVLVKDKIIKQ